MLRWLVNIMISSMIFFPEKTFYEKPEAYGLPYENMRVRTEDGITIHGWFLKSDQEHGVLIFFHGNAGNISGRIYKAEGWIKRGYSVLLVDYRGYGKSEGEIRSQEDILLDSRAAYEWLRTHKGVPPSGIIAYGESLGTHPAIRLAVEGNVAAVILEAPFTSFLEIGKRHYPFVNEYLLRDFLFPNKKYIDELKAPLFVMHGTADEICPYEMAGELFEKAPSPKEFFTITDGGHNDLPIKAGEDYWEKPAAFLKKHLG